MGKQGEEPIFFTLQGKAEIVFHRQGSGFNLIVIEFFLSFFCVCMCVDILKRRCLEEKAWGNLYK